MNVRFFRSPFVCLLADIRVELQSHNNNFWTRKLMNTRDRLWMWLVVFVTDFDFDDQCFCTYSVAHVLQIFRHIFFCVRMFIHLLLVVNNFFSLFFFLCACVRVVGDLNVFCCSRCCYFGLNYSGQYKLIRKKICWNNDSWSNFFFLLNSKHCFFAANLRLKFKLLRVTRTAYSLNLEFQKIAHKNVFYECICSESVMCVDSMTTKLNFRISFVMLLPIVW